MDWVEQFDKQVADFLPDVKIAAAEPMAKHTSFRVGGPARRMAFPDQAEQLLGADHASLFLAQDL